MCRQLIQCRYSLECYDLFGALMARFRTSTAVSAFLDSSSSRTQRDGIMAFFRQDCTSIDVMAVAIAIAIAVPGEHFGST